ncbi:MAG: kinase/pyrophosphorylase [Gammaproteobacteria bacterium]|nr:kinase/pyrophosphorylase [Gammaproteobacteria bacterium]MDH3858022.1 kinase/pyrophosphorylase [Gammaproteobacteria bacterium]
MQSSTRQVFFLSNGTAITAETLGLSLLAQFPDHKFQTRTIPFIDTLEKAHAVAEEVNCSINEANQLPIVICTMGDDDLMKIINQTKALVIDPFGDILPRFEKVLAAQHHQPDQSHRTVNPSLYESRIDAIDYAMQHDDGGRTHNYDEADIILVGVSRSGKTPSCLYLALQFGIKAANYPITEEDMQYEKLPEPLRAFKGRLYGLTTDLNRLVNVRQERRPDSRYSSLEQCRYELRAVEDMYRRHEIPYINTSAMSVEEISARIIRDNELHRTDLN